MAMLGLAIGRTAEPHRNATISNASATRMVMMLRVRITMSAAMPGRRHWMKARAASRRWLTRFAKALEVHLAGVFRKSG
jgi:hypothetical protein